MARRGRLHQELVTITLTIQQTDMMHFMMMSFQRYRILPFGATLIIFRFECPQSISRIKHLIIALAALGCSCQKLLLVLALHGQVAIWGAASLDLVRLMLKRVGLDLGMAGCMGIVATRLRSLG